MLKEALPLFRKADRKKLEKAVASGDFLAVSRALGISGEELRAVLTGAQPLVIRALVDFLRQRNLMEEFMEFAESRSN